MVYLFGKDFEVVVVYHEDYLTEEERNQAIIVLDKLPDEPEKKEGFEIKPFIDAEKKEFHWEYVDVSRQLKRKKEFEEMLKQKIITIHEFEALLKTIR